MQQLLDERGEVTLNYFSCAVKMKILLQGHIYVTERAVYFYSPFNDQTVFGGNGTEIMISYDAVSRISKETTLRIFPNAIRFTFDSHLVLEEEEELVFTSFLSRDACYDLVMRQYDIY